MRTTLAALVGGVALLAAPLGPANATTLFGLVDTGELFASLDGGVSWTIQSTLPVRDAVGLLRATPGELHLVSRSGTIYLSDDGGASWSAVGVVPASDVVAIDVGLRPQITLLLLTETGTLWESSDGGVTFSAVATLTASDHVSLTHDVGGNLYALTETGTVRESADGGVTWVAKGALPVSDAVEVEAFGLHLVVLTGAGDVWSSSDGGTSWSPVGTLSQVHMCAMLLGEPGALFATTQEGEVATSADGSNWTWVGLINQLNVVALATDLPPTGVEVLWPTIAALQLLPPRPNPRHGPGGSWFDFTLPGPETIRFTMYDVRGRTVASRAQESIGSGGPHSVHWDPGVLPSGAYFVRLSTESGRSVGTRWVLVR